MGFVILLVFFDVIIKTRQGLCLCSAAELHPSPESHCVAQAVLELLIFPPLLPKYLITPHRRLSEVILSALLHFTLGYPGDVSSIREFFPFLLF